MRSLQAASNSFGRYAYYQMNNSFTQTGRPAERTVTRSAAVLAAFGIGLSSFSLKQMISNGSKRF